MALTSYEKARVRYHLGYPVTTQLATLQAGAPVALPTLFLVEQQMDALDTDGLVIVRAAVTQLDAIDNELVCARKQLAVDAVGEITMAGGAAGGGGGHPTVTDRLEGEYRRWAQRLADALGVPLYAYSTRHAVSARGINVKVQR